MPISGYFDVVFAVSGTLTSVPDAVQVSGSISYTQGWGPYYSQDPTVDPSTALLIDRAQTNQLFNDVTTAIQFFQQGNAAAFITTTMNGGTPYSYSAGNTCQLGGVIYQSLVNANTDIPPSAKWQALPLGGTSQIQGIRKNLKGTYVSNATATFTADSIMLAASGGSNYLLTAFNKMLNTGTSGAGGLDSGSLASSTSYFVYAIYDADSSTPNILFSTSATAPSLPSGYTFFARIGSFFTDGSSHIIGFVQDDNATQYKNGANLSALPTVASGTLGNVTAGTYVSTSISGLVPSTATRASFVLSNGQIGSGGGLTVMVAPNNSYGAFASQNPAPLIVTNPQTNTTYGGILLESTNVFIASNSSLGLVQIAGYTDNF